LRTLVLIFGVYLPPKPFLFFFTSEISLKVVLVVSKLEGSEFSPGFQAPSLDLKGNETHMKLCLSLVSLAAVAAAGAQTVVPSNLANTDANATFAFFVEGSSSRTYQSIIAASQLTDLVGRNLTGVSFRINAGSNGWPGTGGSMSMFEVRIGEGVAPSAVTGTFANNFVGDTSLVRSGSLTIDSGAYTTGGSPNAFGTPIGFDTPYLYSGGNLTIEYRYSGMPMGTGQPIFDAAFTGQEGFGTEYASAFATTSWETEAWLFGDESRAIVTQFSSAAPVPEPATMAVLGLGALSLIRKRRNKV
jgi:hypothetical protein